MSETAVQEQTTDPADSPEIPGETPETQVEEAAEESLESAEQTADDADEDSPSTETPAGEAAATDDRVGDDSAEDDTAEDDSSEDDTSEDDEPENVLDVEGEIAADYLEELLDIADLDGDIDTYIESDRAHVSIMTEGDLLVGSDGEVLEALQELSRLAVMTETGHRSRLMLDVAGYRDRRRTALVQLAGDAVQEARQSGEPVRMAPMNPFERKIVHDAVAAAGLTSESEGEEPGRRVVVQPGS